MRKLVYVMSKNGVEMLSTVSFSIAENLKKEGYTSSIRLVEITEKMPKKAMELTEKRWNKIRGL